MKPLLEKKTSQKCVPSPRMVGGSGAAELSNKNLLDRFCGTKKQLLAIMNNRFDWYLALGKYYFACHGLFLFKRKL